MQSAKIGLILAALAITTPAMAAPEGWRISEKSGNVTVLHSGVSKIALQGHAVSVGDVVSTGPNGRAVLVRGQEYLVVAPGSRLRVADPAPSGGFIQIIQDVGNVIFKIKRKSTPHFAVQTPYLAAVVKGTTFSVTVGEAGASVQVIEGAVEVKTVDGGASDLVTPGMVAAVTARDMYTLKVDGDTSTVTTSPNAPSASGGSATGSGTSATSETTNTASKESANSSTETASAASTPSESTPAAAAVEARIEAPIVEAAQPVASLTDGLIEGNAAISSPVRAAEVKTESAAPAATTKAVEVAMVTAPAETVAAVAKDDDADVRSGSSGSDDGDKSDDTDKQGEAERGNNESKGNDSAKDVAAVTAPPATVDVAALPANASDNREDDAEDVATLAIAAEQEKAKGKDQDVAAVVTPPATVEVAALPAATVDDNGTDTASAAAAASEKDKASGNSGAGSANDKAKDVATVVTPPATVEVAALPAATVDGNGTDTASAAAAAAETDKVNGNNGVDNANGKAKDVALDTAAPASVEVAALPAAIDTNANDLASVSANTATVEAPPPATVAADVGSASGADLGMGGGKENASIGKGIGFGRGKGAD